MISNDFYNKNNLIKQFLGGKVYHYGVKDKSITLAWYSYVVKKYENLYTIAAKCFGEGLEYMWPYIADNNPPRMPDAWLPGDIIRLPKLVIKDSDTLRTTYTKEAPL